MSDYSSICRSLTALFSHRPNKRQRKRGKLRPEGFSAHFAGLQDSRLTRVLHACESLEMRAMLSAMPIVASAENDFMFSNGVITGYTGTGGGVVIPASIGGVAVTSLASQAFRNANTIISVEIPASITLIGDAFLFCGNLTAIRVAAENSRFSSIDGVLYTKDRGTLLVCPAGKSGSVLIPQGVSRIEDSAFLVLRGITWLWPVVFKAAVA